MIIINNNNNIIRVNERLSINNMSFQFVRDVFILLELLLDVFAQ